MFIMDFFRKLFPQIQNESEVPDTNENNNIRLREISIDLYSSQIDVNSNIFENNENAIHDPTSVTHTTTNSEIDSDKILCTLENVAPTKISLNSTLKEIKVMHDVISQDTAILNEITYNTEVSKSKNVKDETLQNLKKINKEPIAIKVMNDEVFIEAEVLTDVTNNTEASSFKNVVDDETLTNLREFEETLNNFDTTACIADDFGVELINLDEFNEMLDNLDTVNEDSYSQISSVGHSTFENKSTIHRNKVDEINENFINSETNPLTIQNLDIISIHSSIEDEKSKNINDIPDTISISSESDELQKTDCDGYNSSDFEFISETEANMDGFIINFRQENYQNVPQASSEHSRISGQFIEEHEVQASAKEASDPGEGPSGLNRPKNQFEYKSYRNNHAVPIGDDYLGLFQGIYNPSLPLCEIYFMENKSVRASAMNIQYDGIGFDKQLALRRHQPDSSEDEFEDEAKECAKRILNMYPGENKKRRRRY